MDLPWYAYIVTKYHTRYSSVTTFKFYPLLGKHSDWFIMDFIDKGTDED